MKKVVHYINQFFAGIGGESDADFQPVLLKELSGPSKLLNEKLEGAEVVATIVCGDNYYGENTEKATSEIIELLKDVEFDYFISGPTFRAGRYGVAAEGIASTIENEFKTPVLTSMNDENPGVELYKEEMYILKGGASAAKMRQDITALAKACDKLIVEGSLETAEVDNFFSRGKRHIDFSEIEPASKRSVDMLVKKLKNEPFQTELPIPENDLVEIAKPLASLKEMKVALVTSGGIVPSDNPDKIQSASATRWGMYDISALDTLKIAGNKFKTIHAGYDPAAADEDPNRVVPLDVLKDMEKAGIIKAIDSHFYTTVGTGTTENEAKRMGNEIADILLEHEVNAVILTST